MKGRVYRGAEAVGEAADEEAVARIAAEIGSPGVEVREDGGGAVRYRLYFPEGAPPALTARLSELWREYACGDGRDFAAFEERERDWWAAARESFTGMDVGPFWIGPPWIDPPPRRRTIRVNPGRAFGTGLHPTTRIALRLLLPRVAPETRVLDLGTGSGILALAALELGARDVLALDVDPDALLNARENAALNASASRIRLVAGSLAALAPGSHAFDLILANLEHTILRPLLPRLVSALAPEGELAVSGVTLAQRPLFLEAAGEEGLASREEAVEEDWWGAVLSSA